MAILNIRVDSLPDSDAVPGGQYKVRIDEIAGPEEDKNGVEYISVTYVITDGEYTNRKIVDGYVPLSGKSKLRRLLNAIGFSKEILAETEDIIGEELDIIVGMEKSDEYGDQNKVRSYIVPTKKPKLAKTGR